MVSNSYLFFNIFHKYIIMEKRIEEFVKIAIAVKCNRGATELVAFCQKMYFIAVGSHGIYYFIDRFFIFNFSCLTEPEGVRK
jgi:hypothetical protein